MGALANYASVGLQTGFYNNQLKYDYYFFNCPLHKVLVVSFRKIWKLSLDRNTDRPTDRAQIINNYKNNDDESVEGYNNNDDESVRSDNDNAIFKNNEGWQGCTL